MVYKRFGEGLLLLIPALLCLSCSSPDSSSDASAASDSYVVATLPVVAHIVRPVAGDGVIVQVLIDRPVSPHAYELRPTETRLVAGASGVFAASRGVDGWISTYAGQNVRMLFENRAHGWTDPVGVAEAADSVSAHLCHLFPDRCDGFRRRAGVFTDSLRRVTDRVSDRASSIEPGTIAVSEPFFSPFLERFGIGADVVLRTVPEHDPSPASVRRAADDASGVQAIVVPSTTRDRLAEQLAEARGWAIIEIDPIGLGFDDYFSWLSASVDSLLANTPDT